MQKRDYSTKQMAVIILLSIAMLAAAAVLNQVYKPKTQETSTSQTTVSAVEEALESEPPAVSTREPSELPNPEEQIATYLQGPKSWKEKRFWSGEWGEEYYDSAAFGGFGCGLCCMANIYSSLSGKKCSPVDMYQYAKRATMYEGGGAIDWGYMKQTMTSAGFQCTVGNKPDTYEKFQNIVKKSQACIVVVSSSDCDVYWKNTPGHYVTLFLYNEETDKVFLADSGDPEHNRQWVALKKIYRSLKTANNHQYMSVKRYEPAKNRWKCNRITGNCVLPQGWEKPQ